MRTEVIEAHRLLSSLNPGDRVMLTELPAGRVIGPLTVQPTGRGRSDGNFGSFESFHVTVGYGPGRWNTAVGVDSLAGYGPVKAGKPAGAPRYRLERVTETT